jgi:UDP-2,4-diacetamido-2,4,6-trideoxy-beta-L-altropyranose hydrolase
VLNIAIIADASTQIGTGHIMRMLSLCDYLKQYAKICFFSRVLEGNLGKFVLSSGYGQVYTTSLLPDLNGYDVVIVDHYEVTFGMQQKLRAVLPVVVVDDLFTSISADLVLNHNIYANDSAYQNLVDPETILCTGAQYALINRKFLEHNIENKAHILVSLGGSDSDNITQKVVELLIKGQRKEPIVVVVGASNPHYINLKAIENNQITIVRSVDNMSTLMAQAYFAITAGGTTTLETLAVSIPSIVIEVADNQAKIVEHLNKNNLAITYHKDELYQDEFNFSFPTDKEVKKLEKIRFSDRLDVLVQQIRKLGFSKSTMQKAKLEDMQAVFTLSNETAVRKNSLNTKVIPLKMHQTWYTKVIDSSDVLFLLFKSKDGTLLAQVRFSNLLEEESLIGISLDPEVRRLKLAGKFLQQALDYYKEQGYRKAIKAQIKVENDASLALFKNKGFKILCESDEIVWLKFNIKRDNVYNS